MDYLASTQQSVAWFRKAADEGSLEIAPPFQRNPVWLQPQKAFLIDSILRGYPIPELYVQTVVDALGHEKHVVVDGQQRIRACLEFAAGDFPLDPNHSPEFGDVTFDGLPQAAKIAFYNYKFVIRVLPETAPELLRELFARLNRNVVALNSQELRHATYWGQFITLVEALATHEFWPTSGIFTVNDFRRMLDVEFVSELAIGVLHGPQNKKDRLDDWYAAYELEFESAADVDSLFRTVLAETSQMLPSLARTRWSKKSDFYSLFLAFAERRNEMPFARGERTALAQSLAGFAARVDLALKLDEPAATDSVREYANAVARAASDLQNRISRVRIIRDLIEEALGQAAGFQDVSHPEPES